MKSKAWPLSRYALISQACGLLVAIISGAALIGWFASSAALKGVRADYIPMAPNTALVFLCMAGILAIFLTKSKKYVWTARVAALAASAWAGAGGKDGFGYGHHLHASGSVVFPAYVASSAMGQ